jgi:F0F1-type ATP synthase assembly protein I
VRVSDVPTEEPAPESPRPPAADQPSSLTAAARHLDHGGQAFDFFSSAAAGLLLGLGIDWLAGTSPWFTIVGVVAGFVSGFTKLWVASRVLEEQAVARQERRRG